MSSHPRREDGTRLKDIAEAATAISDHLQVLEAGLAPEQIVIEAIKYNLVAIGEAVAHLSDDVRDETTEIDWLQSKGSGTYSLTSTSEWTTNSFVRSQNMMFRCWLDE